MRRKKEFWLGGWSALLLLLAGCNAVPDAFLEAERAVYASLAPFVSHAADREASGIKLMLLLKKPENQKAILRQRLKTLEDHKRTLIAWDFNLGEHEKAAGYETNTKATYPDKARSSVAVKDGATAAAPVALAAPELDSLRDDTESSPEIGARNGAPGPAHLEPGVVAEQSEARLERRALA